MFNQTGTVNLFQVDHVEYFEMYVITEKTMCWRAQKIPRLDHEFYLLQVQGPQG